MKVSINVSENRLLIKAVDKFYNVYMHVVPNNDVFVVNFCNRNLNILEELLKNYEVEENDGFVVVKIEKPIYLSYKLVKQETNSGDISNMIIGKLQEMQLQINSQNERIKGLEEQLENGVILPGYGIIDKNETELFLRSIVNQNNFNQFGNTSFSDFKEYNFSCKRTLNIFYGNNIKPIKYLNKLKKFAISYHSHSDKNVVEFSPLKHCKKMTHFYVDFSNISDISFMEELTKLEEVYFVNCPEIQTINILANLPNLRKFGYKNCPKIGTMPNFNSKVEVFQR
jgi:transposase-like protein